MDVRRELINYLRRQLVGPANGETEEITAPPDRRYLMGTLYPQDSDLQRRLAETHEEPDPLRAERATEETQFADDPVPESNAWLPSSLGLSVFTDADELILVCRAARYITVRGQGPRHWRRKRLPSVSVPVKIGQTEVKVFDGRAEVRLRWRPFGNGNLVTVALVNSAFAAEPVPGKRPQPQWDDMLFQVSLEVEPVGGALLPYPSVRLTSRDLEEQELRLQYRHVVIHAVGHGCAVEEERASGTIAKVRTQVMPEAEIPGVHAAGAADSPVLTLAHLCDLLYRPPSWARSCVPSPVATETGTNGNAKSKSLLWAGPLPIGSWSASESPWNAWKQGLTHSARTKTVSSCRRSGWPTGPWPCRCGI